MAVNLIKTLEHARTIWLTLMILVSVAVYAADNRYMTIQGGNELAVKVSNAARLKQIKHEMFIINYKIQDGSAKPLDRAILQQLKDEREELLK